MALRNENKEVKTDLPYSLCSPSILTTKNPNGFQCGHVTTDTKWEETFTLPHTRIYYNGPQRHKHTQTHTRTHTHTHTHTHAHTHTRTHTHFFPHAHAV